jgi:Uma2 family endonuclease
LNPRSKELEVSIKNHRLVKIACTPILPKRNAMPTLLETPPPLQTAPYLVPERMMKRMTKHMSIHDFRHIEFDDNDTFYYELINGELAAKSAPSPYHQRISGNISFALRQFVTANNLGEVLYAPIDVFLDEENASQPDVLFLSKAKQHFVTPGGVQGSPDLVVEIISPSSIKRDRGDKMKLYERCGIGEYWLVDARTRSVEVYVNTLGGVSGEGYDFDLREVYVAENDETLEVVSVVMLGFTMPLEAVFSGVE